MTHQPTLHVFSPRGGEAATDVRWSSRTDRSQPRQTPVTRALCPACAQGSCSHIPPIFTPEQRALIDETVARVRDAFRLSPGDPGPDLTSKKIRRLCRKMVRTHGAIGMTEEMTREARLHFYLEGHDAFGNPALFP